MALTALEKISHLYRRVGFGASPAELTAATERGLDATLEMLLNPERVEDDVDLKLAQVNPPLDLSKERDLQVLWLFRMLHTRRPLIEKMTLFWHNHFATANYKVNDAGLMLQQNNLFRSNALGNFRRLVLDVSRDPAMLIWLDGNLNKKGNPNENFARELMELFTTGIGHYSERDVDEVARTFTGWQFLRDRTTGATTFYRNDSEHDSGTKTVLGRTGNLDGTDVIDMLVPHPATAARIASELFKYFVHDNPTQAQIDGLAKIYLDSKYEIKPVVRAILTSPAFFSEEAYLARVKSPVEFVIGSLKQLAPSATNLGHLPEEMARMGQELFNPPTVFGWDGGLEWVNSTTMLARMNYANTLSQSRGSAGINPATILSQNRLTSPELIVSFFAQALGAIPYSAGVRADLAGYITQTTGNSSADSMDTKVRGLVHLMLGTAEYQLA
jgi:uncharacterized protein (DUF1800 family)